MPFKHNRCYRQQLCFKGFLRPDQRAFATQLLNARDRDHWRDVPGLFLLCILAAALVKCLLVTFLHGQQSLVFHFHRTFDRRVTSIATKARPMPVQKYVIECGCIGEEWALTGPLGV